MKPFASVFCSLFLFSCPSPKQETPGNEVLSTSLDTLNSSDLFPTLYSHDHEEDAYQQADLL